VTHLLYNPESNTHYSIVPGLFGHHPDHDHGADDLPGADPASERARDLRKPAGHCRPRRWKIMIGKISPNVLVGMVQSTIVLTMARYVFDVPFLGSLPLARAGR